MSERIVGARYCSWCFEKHRRDLREHKHALRRNVYRCLGCKKFSVKCLGPSCENMAMAQLKNKKRLFCAEHDGTIANFKTLNAKIPALSYYKRILKRNKRNLAKDAKIAKQFVLKALVMGLLTTIVGGPTIASVLGRWGLLGAASTGTKIASLRGAALARASLAFIGGGSMAKGSVFITAAGSALGGVRGGVLANIYFDQIKFFHISKQLKRDLIQSRANSCRTQLVFVNGFLEQKDSTFRDWLKGTINAYKGHRAYGLNWESNTRVKTVATGLLGGNTWRVTHEKTTQTGHILADLIARIEGEFRHTLMGHSLGALVIYYALRSLSKKKNRFIQDVILLGGAVDRNDSKGWAQAAQAVHGNIYNCYSAKDKILRQLYYKPSTRKRISPIGIGPINKTGRTGVKNIVDVDVTDLVSRHGAFKPMLNDILARIDELRPRG